MKENHRRRAVKEIELSVTRTLPKQTDVHWMEEVSIR